MDVPDGGYTSKPTLHRKSSFSILSKCILRFLRINSLCPGNKKRVKNAGNLINIRNNTFKKSPPNSVLEEKAVLFP